MSAKVAGTVVVGGLPEPRQLSGRSQPLSPASWRFGNPPVAVDPAFMSQVGTAPRDLHAHGH